MNTLEKILKNLTESLIKLSGSITALSSASCAHTQTTILLESRISKLEKQNENLTARLKVLEEKDKASEENFRKAARTNS